MGGEFARLALLTSDLTMRGHSRSVWCVDDEDDGNGAIVAGWTSGAPEAQRDAHNRALIWALGLERQVKRVRTARLDFMAEHERTMARGVYDDDSAEPPRRMQAEILLMFIAAGQLLRSLDAFDGDRRPHEGLDPERVRLLRNALEHWDEPAGRSQTQLAAQDVDPETNRWRQDGSGVVGHVDDRDLQAWARAVYEDVRTWDPW